MKPLPAPENPVKEGPVDDIPSLPNPLPNPLPSSAGPYSTSNRRSASCPLHKAYPWLLSCSTAVAAVFCLMYITKPVVVSTPTPASNSSAKAALANANKLPAHASMMPSSKRLPGEQDTDDTPGNAAQFRRSLPAQTSASVFEETNLRVQHVLTAEAPGGHMARIDLDVPVIYQSRSLRWTPANVAEARKLLLQLMDYQDKSRQLRSEGVGLLDSWNRLIADSIPAPDLRADSPSLPANQEDSSDAPRPTSLISTESVQIQPAGK